MVDTRYFKDPSETTEQYKARTSQYYSTPAATPAVATPAPTPTPSPLSIGDIYGSVSSADKGIESSVGVYKGIADGAVDEEAIRAATMKRLQAEIDATTAMSAEKMRQAHIVGESNLGSNAAISGRRGLLGSDFGVALNKKVLDDNSAVYDGIEQEKVAKIASITNKGIEFAQKEIADKLAAKQQGAANYITFLGEAEKRRTTRTSEAAKRALAAGIDLSSVSGSELKAIADSYQISPDALVNSYLEAVKEKSKSALDQKKVEAETAKSTAEAEKAQRDKRFLSVADGADLYDTDTGELVAQNAEDYAPQRDSFTSYQQFQATQNLKKTAQTNTAAARELQRQNNIMQSTWQRYSSGEAKDLNGTTQAIVATFNKILDPSSVVRETEYDRSASGQALRESIEGKINRLTQGGAGLTPASLKELVDLGAIYTKNAQLSIDAANRKAQEEAEYWGLPADFVTTSDATPDAETREVNGYTYVKVDGGWELQK